MKLCEIIGGQGCAAASDSHLDLGRAPYVLYGVKYIDLVSLALPAGRGAQGSGLEDVRVYLADGLVGVVGGAGPVTHTLT